ncbi:MAG: hypothetical protein ACNS60_11960 [Candidatus Cyclobacteriaceae bacterium M2_1C_046]
MKKNLPEFLFLVAVIFVSITGFWELYFGVNAKPNAYHHLHVITSLTWLILLLIQLSFIEKKNFSIHRNLGLSIFFLGPLLVATVALLSVHSANRAVISNQEDFLIVSNVMVTLELGLIILTAFILKKNRKLHGSFLISSALLFMGIALVFTLISFIPYYKIEGPETFYKFGVASSTSRNVCVIVGLFFFLKDMRYGWPWLLVLSFFFINGFINTLLIKSNKIDQLTIFVGSLDQTLTFIGSFILFLILLISTGRWNIRKRKKGKIQVLLNDE